MSAFSIFILFGTRIKRCRSVGWIDLCFSVCVSTRIYLPIDGQGELDLKREKNCETGPTRRTILVPTFHAGVILLGRLGDVLDLIDRQGRWKKAHSPIGSHTSPLNWLQDQIEMMCGPFVCAC